jgi:hypothetical protein
MTRPWTFFFLPLLPRLVAVPLRSGSSSPESYVSVKFKVKVRLRVSVRVRVHGPIRSKISNIANKKQERGNKKTYTLTLRA